MCEWLGPIHYTSSLSSTVFLSSSFISMLLTIVLLSLLVTATTLIIEPSPHHNHQSCYHEHSSQKCIRLSSPVPNTNRPTSNVISFTIHISDTPTAPPIHKLTLAIFKVSRSAIRVVSDDWMGRTSNKDYPLLLSTIFDNFFNGLPPVDNFRDACIGHFNITEICLEGFAVLHARGVAEIEVPILNAGEYHIEAWVGEEEEVSINNSTNVQDNIYFIDKYEGYNTTVKITPSRVEDVVEVGQLEFWLDYSDQVSYWWGNYFGLLHQTQSWMDMFDEAFNAARPLIDEGGQILEFGVAHGRSLLRLAHHARAWNRTVVGFDSFRGLPEAWGPKFNSPGLFDMGGIIPERILKVDNARLNIGLFRDTLPLLDWDIVNTTSFIAFLHIDCDIYSSALEILTTVACLLREGSIVVFDELFNMQGTYTSKEEGRAKTSVSWWEDGEFLALQHSMQLLGLHLKPLKEGIYFEQAVPLIVTKPPTSSTRCDMIRHTMVEAKPSAINTEDYNALLSFKVTAAHILDKWQPDGPHKEDLQKIYLGDDDEVDRKTVESILRHAVVMLDENE